MFNILDILSIAEFGLPGTTTGEIIGAILIAVAFMGGMIYIGGKIADEWKRKE